MTGVRLAACQGHPYTIPPGEPGHLGLASMRERAELMDGTLEIETSELGTRVLILAPLGQPA